MSPSTNISLFIPQDIICCVVDQCRRDFRTLKNCALVAPNWLPIAQRHLYSCLTVRDTRPGHGISSLNEFLEENTSICAYVQTLRILDERGTVVHFLALVAKFPFLKSLVINSTVMSSSPLGIPLAQIGPIPATLESLHARRLIVGDSKRCWEPLFELITAFASIHKLSLEDSWIPSLGPDSEACMSGHSFLLAPARRTRVQSLLLLPFPDSAETALLHYITEFLEISELQSLQLIPWCAGTHAERAYQSLFDAMIGLKSLDVDLCQFVQRDLPALSLKSCASLEFIKFSIAPFHGTMASNIHLLQGTFRRVVAMLSSLHQPRIVGPDQRVPRRSPKSHPLSKIWFQIVMMSELFTDEGAEDNIRTALQSVGWRDLLPVLELLENIKVVKFTFLFYRHPELRPDDESTQPRGVGSGLPALDLIREELSGIASGCALQIGAFNC